MIRRRCEQPNDVASSQDTDSDGDGDGDGDGVNDSSDAFPLDANEIINTDLDGIGNNTAHACPLDHTETVDADGNVINFTNSTMFVFNNCIVDSATFFASTVSNSYVEVKARRKTAGAYEAIKV